MIRGLAEVMSRKWVVNFCNAILHGFFQSVLGEVRTLTAFVKQLSVIYHHRTGIVLKSLSKVENK